MNVYCHVFSNYITTPFKESILSNLTAQQKKICIVVSIVLAFLAACYLASRYCFNIAPVTSVNRKEQDLEEEMDGFFSIEKQHPSSKEVDSVQEETIYDPTEDEMDGFFSIEKQQSSSKAFSREEKKEVLSYEKEEESIQQEDLEKLGAVVENLPEDVLICIFTQLDFKSWKKLLYINKQFHNICLNHFVLTSLLDKNCLPHPVLWSSKAKAKTMILKSVERSAYLLEKLNLTSLDLTEDELKKIISICSNLKELNLRFVEFSDSTEDEILKHLPSGLKSLVVNNITDDGLKHFKRLPNLHSLTSEHCQNITDKGLEHLTVLSALQDLTLGLCSNITDERPDFDCNLDLICADKIANKTYVDRQPINPKFCCNITDKGLEYLKIFSNLRSLTIHSGCITDNGLEHLQAFSHLQYLNLTWCENIRDNGLEHLKTLSNLRSLSLACTKMTDIGLEHLKALSGLQFLDLSGCNITDHGLEHLKAFSALQFLRLSKCDQITDKGLEYLKILSSLQFLGLRDCQKITNDGLQYLQALSALQSLDLSNTQITDKGLEHLKTLSALQSLKLHYCSNITDNGLQYLQSLWGGCRYDFRLEWRYLEK